MHESLSIVLVCVSFSDEIKPLTLQRLRKGNSKKVKSEDNKSEDNKSHKAKATSFRGAQHQLKTNYRMRCLTLHVGCRLCFCFTTRCGVGMVRRL